MLMELKQTHQTEEDQMVKNHQTDLRRATDRNKKDAQDDDQLNKHSPHVTSRQYDLEQYYCLALAK